MELESRHRAKAVVCASKQRAPSEDGDGDPAPPQGQRPEDLGHRADERKPLFA